VLGLGDTREFESKQSEDASRDTAFSLFSLLSHQVGYAAPTNSSIMKDVFSVLSVTLW
jgi:hypothetical protein